MGAVKTYTIEGLEPDTSYALAVSAYAPKFWDSEPSKVAGQTLPQPSTKAELQKLVNAAIAENPKANLNYIDTRNIKDMTELFKDKSGFNGDISSWDVSNVKYMRSMFEGAAKFNGNISGWNPVKVTDMERMLKGATAFTQDLSGWTGANKGEKVWEVRAWGEMFDRSGNTATATQPQWRQVFASCGPTVRTQRPKPTSRASDDDGSKAELIKAIKSNDDNGYTGYGNLNNSSSEDEGTATGATNSLAYIDTSRVTDMSELFKGKKTFNGDIKCWDVSSVTGQADDGSPDQGMHSMFANAVAFNQDIGGWDTRNVVVMSSMFAFAAAFNNGGSEGIGNWDTGDVKGMSYMFSNATAFDRPIGGWDVSKVKKMNGMFDTATSFNRNIGSWKVSSVTDMTEMFNGAAKFNQNIGSWTVSSVTTMKAMFNGAAKFNQDLTGWESTLSPTLKGTMPASIFDNSGMASNKNYWPSGWRN